MTSEPTRARAHSAPGTRLFLLLGLGALLLLLAPPALRTPLLLGYNALLALLFAYDRARLRASRLALQRELPRQLRPRTPTPYTLALALEQGPALRLSVEERGPRFVQLDPGRFQLRLRPGERVQLTGELSLARHGRVHWERLWLRRESALGLCALITEHALPASATAYPAVPKAQHGLTRIVPRRAGTAPAALRVAAQGGEIERLREYVSTDPMRSLDWKATAKRRRPITRSYQPERNQTLWIVLDTSRVMTLPAERALAVVAPSGPKNAPFAPTRFEAVLEAALSLADTALGAGDRVGLLAYGREAKLCVAPRAGHGQLLALLEHSLTLHAEPTELDPAGLLATLARCAPKRSLVVLFTDLDNEGDLRELARHARLLVRRHVGFCVSLRPALLEAQRTAAVAEERDVYRKLAAISLHEQRQQLARDLAAAGLSLVESSVPQLGHAIVQRYHAEKTSGRL